MKKQVFIIFATLFLCLHSYCAENGKLDPLGSFIIPDGETIIRNDSSVLILVVIQNNTKDSVILDTLRMKGKEQFKQHPKPKRQKHALPYYIDKIVVQFLDHTGKTVTKEEVLFPVSSELDPGKQMSFIIRVKTPKKSGTYKAKLTWESDEKAGEFAFDNREDTKRVTAMALRDLTIGKTRIGGKIAIEPSNK